ncbi:F-box protein At3g07870-like [Papaver somniferum]|uniref:F-box protein At3g07870-like n=1 Tax=Papaver somniferum TaxID=3469 RepID=UPI000E6FD42F|nr:F-box protein At3g07870-like [Papaver somniferum]
MEDSNRNCLPEEVTLNIFSRLPVETVLDCKLVYKAWRNLIRLHGNTNYFAYQHLERRHPAEPNHGDGSDCAPMSFVFFDCSAEPNQGPQELYYAEYQEDNEITDPKFSIKKFKINFDFQQDIFGIVGSCNGVICLSVCTKFKTHASRSLNPGDGPREPLYICNPITREILNLPGLSIPHEKQIKGVRIAHGFGYHPLTNEYKVVRICYIGDLDKPSKGQVEVYTLGSGKGWRHICETSYNLCSYSTYSGTPSGVLFNGALHWLHKGSDGIMEMLAFDLHRENFDVLPTPESRFEQYYRTSRLRIIRGRLCHVSQRFERVGSWGVSRVLDLWFLKNNNKEMTSSSTYPKEQYEYKYSWLTGCSHWAPNMLFACTSKGEALMAKHGKVYRLKNRGKRIPERKRRPIRTWEINKNNQKSCVEPIPHINSFVSLKALGERSAKIFEESPDGDHMLISSGRATKRFKSAAATSL